MLAQTTEVPQLTSEQAALLGGTLAVYGIVALALFVVAIVALWKIFTKAGEEGWKSLIPIYNTIILLKIIGRPWWWIFLLLIPIVNFVFIVIVLFELSKSFGHGWGYALGLIFLNFIFLLIIGFGEDTYRGPGSQLAEGGVGPMPPAAPAA